MLCHAQLYRFYINQRNMKDYGLNEFSVYTKPNIIEQHLKDKNVSFTIETAQSDKGDWYYGYTVNLPTCGVGMPCSCKGFYHSYKSEEEAISDACIKVREYLENHRRITDGVKYGNFVDSGADKLLKLLKEIENPQPVQLSLF